MTDSNTQLTIEFILDAARAGLRATLPDRDGGPDVTAAREALRLITALCVEFLKGDID
jgi:hypothetical protein